jgi:hypothetical protein
MLWDSLCLHICLEPRKRLRIDGVLVAQRAEQRELSQERAQRAPTASAAQVLHLAARGHQCQRVVTCDDIALVQRLCAKKPTPSSSNCRNSDLRQGLLGLGSHDDLAKIEPAKKGSLDQGGSVGHTKQMTRQSTPTRQYA